jgi:hypothetical protein
MTGNFLPIEKYEQTAIRCREALDKGDYEEARKLLDRLYESDFNRMMGLVEIRRRISDFNRMVGEEIREGQISKRMDNKINSMIDNTKSRLDNLLKFGLELVESQGGQT